MSRRGRKNWKHLAVNKNIAKMLILHRVWNGLNQRKLSEDIGTTFQQYQKVEKCYNRIFAEQLFNICKNRKWDISLFFNADPNKILDQWIDKDYVLRDEKGNIIETMAEHHPMPDKIGKIRKLFTHIDEVAESNYFKTERITNV